MKELTRSYFRAKSSLYNFSEFRSLLNEGLDNSEQKQKMLKVIKQIFVYYWKILKDLLKERGINTNFPRDIIEISIKEGLINKNQHIWLEYIDILNAMIYDHTANKDELTEKILSVYVGQIKYIQTFTESVYYKSNRYDRKNKKLTLDKSKPEYKASEIGIYEEAYKLIFDFLTHNKEIEYVWLHGSRANNTARSNSDIDLLIDSPFENFKNLKEIMKKIRIPYRIDASNIYDPYQYDFNNHVAKHAKIIYRKEDM